MKQAFVILLLIGAIGFGIYNVLKEPDPSAYELSVDIPLDMQTCLEGTDHCMVVDRNCGSCCDFGAINSFYERDFAELFDEDCEAYRGKQCNCSEINAYPSCLENRCQMIDLP
jgi:hypothetical protein